MISTDELEVLLTEDDLMPVRMSSRDFDGEQLSITLAASSEEALERLLFMEFLPSASDLSTQLLRFSITFPFDALDAEAAAESASLIAYINQSTTLGHFCVEPGTLDVKFHYTLVLPSNSSLCQELILETIALIDLITSQHHELLQFFHTGVMTYEDLLPTTNEDRTATDENLEATTVQDLTQSSTQMPIRV